MASTVAVVLNWRDSQSTIACVDSLLALGEDLGIVVVDNASGDGSLERITQFCTQRAPEQGYALIAPDAVAGQPAGGRWIVTMGSGRNGGYAYGNNVGMRVALQADDCRYVWILNADTLVPDASTLRALVARMEEDARIGICGATVVYADDPSCVQTLSGGTISPRGRTDQYGQGTRSDAVIDQASVESRLDYVNGACSFVRRVFIEQVGLMSEDYFLYFEELDWAMRGKDRFRLGYSAPAVVHHHVGKSIGTSDAGLRSTLSSYYLTASHIRFCARHLRGALPFLITEKLREILRLLRRGHRPQALAVGGGLLLISPERMRRAGIL